MCSTSPEGIASLIGDDPRPHPKRARAEPGRKEPAAENAPKRRRLVADRSGDERSPTRGLVCSRGESQRDGRVRLLLQNGGAELSDGHPAPNSILARG